jgi:hypothetical protein
MFSRAVMSIGRTACSYSTLPLKDMPFLSDIIVKAAIGKNIEVTTSFLTAFAPVIHGNRKIIISTLDVNNEPEKSVKSISRDMKNDLALAYRYRLEGEEEAAVMEVMTQNHNHDLAENQQKHVQYLTGRALAHASGHYLTAIDDEAKKVNENRVKLSEAKHDANAATQGVESLNPKKAIRARAFSETDIFTAYIQAKPIHQVMLNDFCRGYGTEDKVWRTLTSSSTSCYDKYSWASPLFSTFRMSADSGMPPSGSNHPGIDPFASFMQNHLSITTVNLPMVPMHLEDEKAWSKVGKLQKEDDVFKHTDLRQWLHYFAHTSLKNGKVEMPTELKANPIFRKSSDMVEDFIHSQGGL